MMLYAMPNVLIETWHHQRTLNSNSYISDFQEYGFQDVKKAAELYDKVVKGVYEKIKTIVNNFHAVITSFKKHNPREIFQDLVDSIKNMPDKVSPLLK